MGFVALSSKPAVVLFHPVVDRFPITPPLDPAMVILLAAAFVIGAVLTMRRPSFGAAILAFVLPFSYDHAIFGATISYPKVILLGVLTGLIGQQGLFKALRGARWPLLAFVAVWIAIILSGIGAEYRSNVVRELLKWIEYALFFLTAYWAIVLDPNLRLVRAAFETSIAVVCVSALAELFTGAPSGMWVSGTSIPRIAGALEGPNQLGGYLETAIVLLAALQVFGPKRRTAWVLGAATVTLLLTFSRAAFIATIVGLLVIVLAKRFDWKRALKPIGAGAVAGAAAATAVFASFHRVALLGLLRESDISGAGAGGVGSRKELWRAAIFFFRRHPLFGIGAANYELRLADAGVYGVRTHANSLYLQALAEGGVTMLAATLFFLIAATAPLYPYLKRSGWALGAFAATIALSVHQIGDYLVFYPKVAEPWIVMVAIGMAARSLPGDACD